MRKCYSLKVAILIFFLIITLTGCNFTEIIDWVTPPGTNPEICDICNLPTYPINVKMNSTYYFFSESYFIIELKNIGSGYDVYNGNWTGWCADKETPIESNEWYQGYIYCSYSPSNRYDIEWPKINWIINNKGSYSAEYIQNAIWHFTNGYAPNGLAMAAEAHSDFCPQSGQKYIAIIDVPGKQLTFIEVPLIEENPEPEIEKIEGVKWNPKYQNTRYPYFLVDYFGKSLVPPWSGDYDYEYPDSIEKGTPFSLIISGENFGEEKGTINLKGRGQITNKLQYFIINVNAWSDNKIKVFPYFSLEDLDFEPVEEAILTIYRPDGKEAEYPVDIIPSIGRQPFGQCTWWTYRRRKEVGKDIPYPDSAYSNKVSLSQNYVPEKYDILIWTEEHHQAFVEEVINKEKGIVRISEYNVQYSEKPYNDEEGYVTGENKIYKFSPNSSPADYYYR